MFALVQRCCIRAKVAVFGISVLFTQKLLYFRKRSCIRAKWSNSAYVVVFGQSGFILAKVVVFGKVVVLGQKGLYSGKMAVFGQKWLFSGKEVVFG